MASGLDLFRLEASSAKGLLLELYNLVLKEDPLRLEGKLPLFDDQKNLIDVYEISIVPTENYPKLFPLVYETNNRLPCNIDWHIYPDGHFCIKAFPEELLICNQNISLTSFIKDQIIPFLFNQKFREEYGYFLKERSHGTKGNIEFFKDVFKTNDLTRIKKCLLFIEKGGKPKRVDTCFCGSGIKYRKCHREAYELISTLPKNVISSYVSMVSSL